MMLMLPLSMGCSFLLSCIVLLSGCRAFKNDATEILYSQVEKLLPDSPNNSTMNRARNGGRQYASLDRNDRIEVGCRELRSTKYISDGQCTSINPVKELVCAGECLPAQLLPNWIGHGTKKQFWGRRNSQEWRCVTDKTRTQRIQLQCQDGTSRTYKITVVTSCKCKRYNRQHNESSHNFEDTSSAKLPVYHSKQKKRSGNKGKHKHSWLPDQLEVKN
ncbi:sclerostin domain-containing protein 1 [Protopterus annectens]|uniref:sclerostin domain-containing protein 1 n=1 Tax=Protopterus annectens TaxID=7888 RepID=UPI001CFBEE07|nr:sclerostin domain-containing protein 1 [Protopterus annectens]